MDYLILLIALLIGSIPTGYIVGKIYGIDVRKTGSGNTGATNVARVLGKKAGILTLIFDILKGIIPIQIALAFYKLSLNFSPAEFSAIAGFIAFLGHCYSPFLKFKGGKGVATGLGVFLIISPKSALLAILIFILLVKISGYVSLGSIIAAFSLPCSNYFFFTESYIIIIIASLVSLVVVYRHRENIERLIQGRENSFFKKKEAI